MTGVPGIHPALVVTATDPRSQGRIRVQVPGVSGTAATGWAEPAMTGGAPPAVGSRVWVLYQNGDPSYPVYLPPLERPTAPLPPSQVTRQVTEPSYTADLGNWVDFTTGQWPRITTVVPPSGTVAVTVSARLRNINTTTSTAWASYRITGGATRAVDDMLALNIQNSARVQASRRNLVTGLPAGASITVVPMWRVSSYGSGDTEVSAGALITEPAGS